MRHLGRCLLSFFFQVFDKETNGSIPVPYGSSTPLVVPLRNTAWTIAVALKDPAIGSQYLGFDRVCGDGGGMQEPPAPEFLVADSFLSVSGQDV